MRRIVMKRAALVTGLAIAGVYAGCETSRLSDPEPPADPVATVTVEPSTATVQVANTVQLAATAKNVTGTALTDRTIDWSSSNTNVATVSPSGVITGVSVGSATITAASEGKSGTAAVTVSSAPPPPPAPVASVTIAPSAATIETNKTVQLAATLKDASGNTLTGRSISWTSSNTAVATVSTAGLVTGASAGSATITATSEGKSGTSTITVTAPPAPVASVTVAPSSASIETSKTVQLTATLTDAANNTLTGRTVVWTSSNNSIATVSNAGLVTGVSAGSATITATSEGKSGAADVTVTAPPPPPPGEPAIFVGAGDIGDCSRTGKEQTALLLDNIPGTVYTTGDNAYPDGTYQDYLDCYDASWGRHKARTKPTAGNHEYHTSGAAGYFQYFGAAAGPVGKGYYSFDLGEWHIIALNSNISMSSSSEQVTWLKADLAANPKRCTLAYWHHPRFSSGKHGNASSTQPLWQALYDANADLILAGHDHSYERFAPQTPTGVADPVRGIREFVIGTGGRSFYSWATIQPNSEVRDNSTWGVVKFTLYADRYDWEFIPVAGKTFTDRGTQMCH